jgi:hypothetical protein
MIQMMICPFGGMWARLMPASKSISREDAQLRWPSITENWSSEQAAAGWRNDPARSESLSNNWRAQVTVKGPRWSYWQRIIVCYNEKRSQGSPRVHHFEKKTQSSHIHIEVSKYNTRHECPTEGKIISKGGLFPRPGMHRSNRGHRRV